MTGGSSSSGGGGAPSNPTHILATGDLELQPAEADPESLTGRILDGRYRVGDKLGAGGVGVVYAGEHVDIKKKVALKVLHGALGWRETFRQRFEREAQASSKLSHPGCVSVIDFGRISKVEPPSPTEPGEPEPLLGTPYLVMELVRGDVLADRIADEHGGRALPPAEALRITRGLLSALRHAHGMGLVHRDIKPANIMLSPVGDPEPWVKLLDFGLAKDLDGEDRGLQAPLTEAGTVFGTPGYLSPEQAAGQRADARSDLYSLGVVLFEMLCGRPPFVGENRMQVVRDHLSTPAPRAKSFQPSLSDELDAVIARVLTKRPDDRYASADEFAAALAACPEARAAGPLTPSASQPIVAPSRTTAPTAPARPSTLPPLPSFAAKLRETLAANRAAALVSAGLMTGLIALAVWIARKPAPPVAAPTPTPVAAESSAAARRHLALADDYQRKLWCSDALDELDKAVRPPDGVPVSSPEVARIAASCLRSKTQTRALRFLVDVVGKSAIPALTAAEAGDPRPDVRAGARAALNELGK